MWMICRNVPCSCNAGTSYFSGSKAIIKSTYHTWHIYTIGFAVTSFSRSTVVRWRQRRITNSQPPKNKPIPRIPTTITMEENKYKFVMCTLLRYSVALLLLKHRLHQDVWHIQSKAELPPSKFNEEGLGLHFDLFSTAELKVLFY